MYLSHYFSSAVSACMSIHQNPHSCLEDGEHFDVNSECQYHQLEPLHPNPIDELEILGDKRAIKVCIPIL